MKIASALEQGGHRVGVYTSPHVSTFRERMQVNGVLISEQQVSHRALLIIRTASASISGSKPLISVLLLQESWLHTL